MAKPFQPNVCYTNKDGKHIHIAIRTYAEVKKKMKAFMKDSFDECVQVYRSRRGEWGEWYEHWELHGNKKVIVKQGWQ